MEQITLGRRYTFVPWPCAGEMPKKGKCPPPKALTGRIFYIHRGHRYFSVAAKVRDGILRESFKY